MGVCNCSMFWCALIYVHYSMAIILKGKRELVALLNLSSWCLMMVEWLFLTVPWGCLRSVIVVFPDHAYLLFLNAENEVFLVFKLSDAVFIMLINVKMQTLSTDRQVYIIGQWPNVVFTDLLLTRHLLMRLASIHVSCNSFSVSDKRTMSSA